MANRAWRNELNNRNYMYGSAYGAPINYSQNVYEDRRNFGNRGGYQDDMKRGKRAFDNVEVSPKKPIRDNNPPPFRRNYVPPGPTIPKKPIAKYSVRPPKAAFDLKEGSIAVLRSRYSRLYIPSDFFHSDFRWQDVFPLYTPLALGNKTSFQMFNSEVEPLNPFDNGRLDPSDANYTYSAKVMLLESCDMENLVKSVCESGIDKKNIFKSLNFLVGTKAKNEPFAIGGAWSPSLDGLNPDEDPRVLINTAIRTCKELTSIDLTHCREWYRFVEYHYYRPADRQGLNISNDNDENRTDSENNFRVETVVIFIPSVWDCMPDEDSWEDLKTRYAMSLEAILTPPLPEPTVEIMDLEDKKEELDEADQVDEKEEPIQSESEKVELDIVEKEVPVKDEEEKDKVEEIESKESVLDVKVVEPVVNEVKELTEKDKKRLEYLYKMNDAPSIVVHQNKSAKNGKFQCQFMSLGHLLEYRADDQKEHTFEVSMFAEQFQEMLQRDAAFNIYKALLKLPKQKELDKNESEPEAKRRREEADVGMTTRSPTTIDSDLLLSFCIYDIDHADYIKEHDLEDILQSIGLDLSRSQAKKLISKAVNRKAGVYYRELRLDDEAVITESDMELSKGNRGKLVKMGTNHSIFLGDLQTTTEKVRAIEWQVSDIVSVFNKTKVELETSRKVHHASKDLENSLRTELKELESQLYSERKVVREVTQTQDVYNSLLRMARDVLERAKSKIDRQFEKETEKDKPKEVVETVTNGS